MLRKRDPFQSVRTDDKIIAIYESDSETSCLLVHAIECLPNGLRTRKIFIPLSIYRLF